MDLVSRCQSRARHTIAQKYGLITRVDPGSYIFTIHHRKNSKYYHVSPTSSLIGKEDYIAYTTKLSEDQNINCYQSQNKGRHFVIYFHGRSSAQKALNILIDLILKKEPLVLGSETRPEVIRVESAESV